MESKIETEKAFSCLRRDDQNRAESSGSTCAGNAVSARRSLDSRPATIAPTSACLNAAFEASREGENWVFLDWGEPVDRGAVAAYKIQRRPRRDGPWSDVGLAVESEITLTNKWRGKEWEYRIIAVNKSGEGEPRNTIMVAL